MAKSKTQPAEPQSKKAKSKPAVEPQPLTPAESPSPAPVERDVPLDLVRVDGGTQTRAGTSQETVDDYVAALQDGVILPGIVLFFDGENYWLADGFHRYYAHQIIGRPDIKATIHLGTLRDAILFALGANERHGLRLTAADRRRKVEIVLNDPEWSAAWSVLQIAKACGVSWHFADGVRKQWLARQRGNDLAAGPNGGLSRVAAPESADDAAAEDPAAAEPPPGPAAAAKAEPARAREPAPASVLTDRLGGPVPSGLRDAFADAALPTLIAEVEALIDAVRPAGWQAAARRLSDHYPYLRAADFWHQIDAAMAALDAALLALTDGRPHALCPLCGGKGCDDCRKCGHVPEWRHEELTGGVAGRSAA